MKTTYGAFIKHLRESRALTQVDVAAALEVGRSSYVALEKGTKELTLAEAVRLVDLFSISIDELLRRQIPNMLKYRHMLLCLVREAQLRERVLKKTKLAALLYLADFAWFYVHQESMSGMRYRKLAYGPVADGHLSLMEDMELTGDLNITQVLREDYHMYEITETRAAARMKLDTLSREEVKLLKTIWKKWQAADTNEIVRFVALQAPYVEAVDGDFLSYESILREPETHIY